MTLRRGFKTEANWYARTFRIELNLRPEAPLCPWTLAKHLAVPVFKLSEIAVKEPGVSFFLSEGGLWEFSGATFIVGFRRIIVINDQHSLKRQASDLSHELSHCVLHHTPLSEVKEASRQYDKTQEAEANYLGPALLISEEAALSIVRRGLTRRQASDIYAVTEDVIQMRINLTGAAKRMNTRFNYPRAS